MRLKQRERERLNRKYHLEERGTLYVLEWMVRGRTVLIQKDTAKGAQASNYRPIACLPMMWKLLTGVMGEKLYQELWERSYTTTWKGMDC